MTRRDLKLLREIARAIELAYLRGRRDGILAARSEPGTPLPDTDKAKAAGLITRKYMTCRPGTPVAAKRDRLLDKLGERFGKSPLLRELVSEFRDSCRRAASG